MGCPSCGSDNTVKCQVLCEQSTVKGVAKSGIYSNTPDVEISQTNAFASRCKPPKEPNVIGPVFWMIISLVCIALILLNNDHWDLRRNDGILITLMYLLGGISFITCLMAIKRSSDKPKYKEDLDAFNKRWICNKCGETYLERK